MDFCKSLDIMQQYQHYTSLLEDDNNSSSSNDDEMMMDNDFAEALYGGSSGSEEHHLQMGMSNNKQGKASKLDRVKRIIDNSGRKRRIYSTIHEDPKQSTRRFRANDRERRRMNSLNGALQALKGCVPSYHGKKRLTKLQILKFACHYISDLSDLLCSPTTSTETLCENNKPNNTNYQHYEHQQQNILATSSSSTIDCDTSYSSADSFMSIIADQQHQQQQQQQQQQQHRHIMNQSHFPSNMQAEVAEQQNINGMSMLQRLDYLTFHGFMAAVTENNNNNMSSVLSDSNNSEFCQMGISPPIINQQQQLYGF